MKSLYSLLALLLTACAYGQHVPPRVLNRPVLTTTNAHATNLTATALTTATNILGNVPNAINPKMPPYNATGDGVTVDTTALQSALTAAAGKTLYLPPGVFMTGALYVTNDTRIVGEGVLKHLPNTTHFTLLYVQQVTNVHIAGITLDGNISNQTTWSQFRHCIQVLDSGHVTIDRVTFTNIIGDGIYVSHVTGAATPYIGTSDFWITRNLFRGARTNRNGVSIITGKRGYVLNNTLMEMGGSGMPGAIDLEPDNTNEFILDVTLGWNIIQGPTNASGALAGQHAIALANSIGKGRMEGIKVVGNQISGNFLYPIYLSGNTNNADSAEVRGNVIKDLAYATQDTARAISTSNFRLELTDNTIEDVFGSGIWAEGGSILIADNTITNVQKQGIVLGAPVTGKVSGNRILDAGQYGSSNSERGAVYFETSGVFFTDNFIKSRATTNSLYGFFSPSSSGTNNYFSGNFISGVGTRNYSIPGVQQWGINFESTAGSSADTVGGSRKIILFNNTAAVDESIFLQFGGVSSGHAAIQSLSGILRAVKSDGSAYAPLYAGDNSAIIGTLGATSFNTTNLTVFGTNVYIGKQIAAAGDAVRVRVGTDLVGSVHLVFRNGVMDLVQGDDSGYAALRASVATVNDEVYGAGWNGALTVPTKNAVYDKIEALSAGATIWANGATVSSPNLTNSTTALIVVANATNVSIMPTNLADAQIATDADIALTKISDPAQTNVLMGRGDATPAQWREIGLTTNFSFNGDTMYIHRLASTNLGDVTGTGSIVLSNAPVITGALLRSPDADYVDYIEAAAPATPASGYVRAYAKSDNKLYIKDDTGAETDLTATGGAGSVYLNGTSVSNPNFTNSATAVWSTAAVTNLTVHPTNLTSAQALEKTGTGAFALSSGSTLSNVTFATFLNLATASDLTIASGAITITSSSHIIDTEAAAATDDLDTINGTAEGRVVLLWPKQASRSTRIKHNTGNIQTLYGRDIWIGNNGVGGADDGADNSFAIGVYHTPTTKWWVFTAGQVGDMGDISISITGVYSIDAGAVNDTALAAGAVDGGAGGEIQDNTITIDDVLNESGTGVLATTLGATVTNLTAMEWLKLPSAAAPTMDADNQVAIDNTRTDHRPMLVYRYAGTNYVIPAIPELSLTAVDGNVLEYEADTDEFKLATDDTGAGGGYTTIQEEGSGLTARNTLNFIGGGATAADNAGSTRTDVTITRAGVYRHIWLDAGAAAPTNSAMAGTFTGPGGRKKDVLDFDGGTVDESCTWYLPMPDEWDRGTIKVKVHWTGAAGAGDVRFVLAAVAISNDDAMGSATSLGTAVAVTDTFLAADDLHISPTSGAITVGGTPTLADGIYVDLLREPGNAADTKTQDARVLGIQVQYLELTTEPAAW